MVFKFEFVHNVQHNCPIWPHINDAVANVKTLLFGGSEYSADGSSNPDFLLGQPTR